MIRLSEIPKVVRFFAGGFLATVLITVSAAVHAAPPTIGSTTVTGLPVEQIARGPANIYQRTVMLGSLAIHGADRFSWDEYAFLTQQAAAISSDDARTLQLIYSAPASRANYPSYFLDDEIVSTLYRMLFDVSPPPAAALLYWSNQLRNYRLAPDSSQFPEGKLILELTNAAIGSSSDPIGRKLNHRLQAVLVVKRESDTPVERNTVPLGPAVYAVSRPRLVNITEDPATYDAAVAPVSRLNWLIDQAVIPSAVSYNATTGVLSVNGTELVALDGPNNDVDLSKLTLYGDGAPYTLTTGAAEITNPSSFQVTLNAADRFALYSRINRDGGLSRGNVKYLLAASQGWNGTPNAAQPDALTGSRITASGTAVPLLNIDNSDATTAYDAATDGVLLLRYLLGVRGDDLVANARGTGANLRSAAEIEAMLAAFITISPAQSPFDVDGDGVVSPLTDGLMILRRLLTPSVATSDSAAMSAITAGAKRGTRTDAQVVNAIDALKP